MLQLREAGIFQKKLLSQLKLENRVFTMDALHCQKNSRGDRYYGEL